MAESGNNQTVLSLAAESQAWDYLVGQCCKNRQCDTGEDKKVVNHIILSNAFSCRLIWSTGTDFKAGTVSVCDPTPSQLHISVRLEFLPHNVHSSVLTDATSGEYRSSCSVEAQ